MERDNRESDTPNSLDRGHFLTRSGQVLIGPYLGASWLGALFSATAATAAPGSAGVRVPTRIVIAVTTDTPTLDAHSASIPRSLEMISNLFSTIMWWPLTPRGFQYPKPARALASRLSANSDKTLFKFTIDGSRKFASGRPITVDDVIWSLRRIGQLPLGQFFYGVMSVDPNNPVTRLDDKTVAITTKSPANSLLEILSLASLAIYEKAVVERHATQKDPWATEWAKTQAAGAGPYVVTRYTPGVSTELSRNPHFSLYKPPVKHLSLPIVPSVADRIALLQRGDITMAEDLPKERLSDLARDENIAVISEPSLAQVYLVMNNDKGPFANRRVRQAVNYALPYGQIIQNAYFGLAQRTTGPIPTGGNFYQRTEGIYTTDLTKAQALMRASGVGRFSADLLYETAVPEFAAVAAIVQATLRPLGINLRIRPTQSAPFHEQRFSRKSDIFVDWAHWWIDDPGYRLQWLHSGNWANSPGYRSKSVDKLIDDVTVEVSRKKRAELCRALQRQVLSDAPVAWICQPHFSYALRKGLTMSPHPTGQVIYGSVRPRH